MFIPTWKMTDDDMHNVSEMDGKIMLWIFEGRSLAYMAEQLNLKTWQVEENIFEIAYCCIRKIGWRKFIKLLFYKR